MKLIFHLSETFFTLERNITKKHFNIENDFIWSLESGCQSGVVDLFPSNCFLRFILIHREQFDTLEHDLTAWQQLLSTVKPLG